MTDDDHALSGAYAVDAVDDLDRARFEQHLATCPECRAEVASLRAAATELSSLAPVTPPERLRVQVLRDITAVRPLPPSIAVDDSGPLDEEGPLDRQARRDRAASGSAATRPHRTGRWLAAAAAVVLIGGGAAVVHPWDRQSQGQVTVAEQVQQAPDARKTEQTLAGGASVAVWHSKSVGRAVIIARNMPPAPAGKVYELWLKNAAGGFVPAGFMPGAGDQTVVLKGDASGAAGAGITVEPQGGSPQPTTAPLALLAFV